MDNMASIASIILGLTLFGGFLDIIGSTTNSANTLIAGTFFIGLPLLFVIVCFIILLSR
jgi:hypothetical protein